MESLINVIETTDYVNKTIEELSINRGNDYTREDCLICDNGLAIHYFDSLYNLFRYKEDYPNPKLELKAILKTIKSQYVLVMY